MHMSPSSFAPAYRPLPIQCEVSIVIKCLNEEKRIAACIESALAALAHVDGEVVLADSCSTDRTLELARQYPIRIVQLEYPDERCCGVGPQLGYQHARGKFVYILDGDMEMRSGFLEHALAFMAANPDVAGVAGQVVEKNTHSLEYLARNEKQHAHMRPGEVDRLDLGGLYRRSAIDAAGYFSDRNLHSYEEFDLAVRLRTLGWRLWRLPFPAVSHHGHDAPPYQLLLRRWHNGYLWGPGELVRAALGQRRLRLVLSGAQELRLYGAVIAWWAALASIPFWHLSGSGRWLSFALLLCLPFGIMSWRKRSASRGLYAVVSWCLYAAGLMRGLLRARKPVEHTIASRLIREPQHHVAPWGQAAS
ncbi:MAG: glycosyl transferase, family 2 [Polaromonas sp.]|nr:glycosyl transferase, family 2 [Polaromonas sp.]